MKYFVVLEEYGRIPTWRIQQQMKTPCHRLIRKENQNGWLLRRVEDKGCIPISANEVQRIVGNLDNTIFNWGNYHFADESIANCINKPSAIKLNTNKAQSRLLLQTHNVSVPATWAKIEDAKYPFLCRTHYHHAGCNYWPIRTNEQKEEFLLANSNTNKKWYYQAIFPKTTEYRVYYWKCNDSLCANDDCHMIRIKEKNIKELWYDKSDHSITAQANFELRSIKDINIDILGECYKALSVIGLNFAAIDVMYNTETKKIAIAELNTNPALDMYSARQIAYYYDKI